MSSFEKFKGEIEKMEGEVEIQSQGYRYRGKIREIAIKKKERMLKIKFAWLKENSIEVSPWLCHRLLYSADLSVFTVISENPLSIQVFFPLESRNDTITFPPK